MWVLLICSFLCNVMSQQWFKQCGLTFCSIFLNCSLFLRVSCKRKLWLLEKKTQFVSGKKTVKQRNGFLCFIFFPVIPQHCNLQSSCKMPFSFELLNKSILWSVHKLQRARFWLLHPTAYLSFKQALDPNISRQCKQLSLRLRNV